MSGLEVAVAIPTFVAVARKVATGISRLSDLKHAPDVLLALNNEIADLQCVVEELGELEQQTSVTLHRPSIPSFRRAVHRANELILSLEKLIAFDLTTFDDQSGRLRVDRSSWLRTQNKVEQAHSDVRSCRIELSMAINLLTSATSIDSYRQINRFGVSIDTFISENAQISYDMFNRLVGMESKLDELTEDITRSQAPAADNSEHNQTESHSELASSTDHTLAIQGGFQVLPTIKFQMLRRLTCHSTCHCACHQTQRYASPGFLESIFGNLFLGYSGMPSAIRKCTVLGCRQDSPKLVKMTYRFPYWFWQRAVSIGFSYTYSTGPELMLRLTCIRPDHSDWFKFARTGNVEGLMQLLVNKQAGLHDVDATRGMTALHWATHWRQPKASGLLIQWNADLAAEDGFGLTPRHCLLFLHSRLYFNDETTLISQQYQNVDNTSLDDILEAPPLHVTYRTQGSTTDFRTSLSMCPRLSLHEKDALGETLLFKAVRQHDSALVQQLLNFGACVEQRNKQGFTCIALASAIGDLSIVRCLLDHGADPRVGNFWDRACSAFHEAIDFDQHAILEYLIIRCEGNILDSLTYQKRAKFLSDVSEMGDTTTLRILGKVPWMTRVMRIVACLVGDTSPPRSVQFLQAASSAEDIECWSRMLLESNVEWRAHVRYSYYDHWLYKSRIEIDLSCSTDLRKGWVLRTVEAED